jgi:hypothetical protein
MTEYEKASLLLQMSVVEYLHIIAWNTRGQNPEDRKRIEQAPVKLAKALQIECPAVVEMLRPYT